MQLLDEHLFALYEQGVIGAEDCIDKSRNAGAMQDKIDTHKRGLKIAAEEEEGPVLRTS